VQRNASALVVTTANPAGALLAAEAPQPVSDDSAVITLEVRDSAYDDDPPALAVGGKEALPARQIPQSVSVISAQRMRDQNLNTVTEALNQVTGVTVIANDSTQSQMLSRGYSLGVMYDGIPAYSALSGTQQFDLDMYEQVEVLRGPSGLFTGTDSPGGVVNLVRKRAQGETALSASAAVGSWNNRHTTLDLTGPLNQDASLRGRLVLALTDRDYFYDKTHTERWLGYGTLAWDITPTTSLTFAAAAQQDHTSASSFGLPAWSDGSLIDAPRETNPIADWSRYRWYTEEYTAELEQRFGSDWSFKAKLSHRPQSFYFKDGYPSSALDRDSETLRYSRRVRDYDYERNALDLYLTGPVELFGRHHTLLAGYNRELYLSSYSGVNATAVTDIPFGASSLVPDFDLPYDRGGKTRTLQSGVYTQGRFSLADPLTLVLGGRLSQFEVKSRSIAPATPTEWSDGASADNEFTPYGALLYDLNDHWTTYFSSSDIFIPQTRERYDGSVLDPRRGRQIEAGLKSELLDGRLQTSLAWFRLRDSDRAYEDPDHAGYYLNAGEVESRGWEVEIVGRPSRHYEIQAGYTLLDTEYRKDSDSQGETFSTWEPRHTAKLWGLRHFDAGSLRNLSLGLGVQAVSGSSAGTGSWSVRSQGGYAVINALARYRWNEHLSLDLHLNNLTDRTYYTRLGGLNTYNTYGEPRNLSLRLQLDY